MGKEAAMAAPPFVHHSTAALHFYGSPGFLHTHSRLWISSLPSPQAMPSQPTAVLSLGLLSNPHVLATSLCPHLWTHLSGWTVHGCGKDHLCKSHTVLPATDKLLCPPPIVPETPLLSQLIFPLVRKLPRI